MKYIYFGSFRHFFNMKIIMITFETDFGQKLLKIRTNMAFLYEKVLELAQKVRKKPN